MFGKKYQILATVEIPYEFELPFNTQDIDYKAKEKVSAYFEAEFNIRLDRERMSVRVEDNLDAEPVGV